MMVTIISLVQFPQQASSFLSSPLAVNRHVGNNFINWNLYSTPVLLSNETTALHEVDESDDIPFDSDAMQSSRNVSSSLGRDDDLESDDGKPLSWVNAVDVYDNGNGSTDNISNEAIAVLLLNLVAVIWGSQHAVIKTIVVDSAAGPFTLLRFGLAAMIASPSTPRLPTFPKKQQTDKVSLSLSDAREASSQVNGEIVEAADPNESLQAWRWGAEMGFWMFLGFAFQAIALGDTTAQRSGFLLYLNVKLVPFFARILFGRNISIPTWTSAFAAFLGTAMLALDGDSIGFNIGDVWSIAAASASAMFILRLEKASQMVPSAAELNATCLWVVTALAAVWSFVVAEDGSHR